MVLKGQPPTDFQKNGSHFHPPAISLAIVIMENQIYGPLHPPQMPEMF